MLDDNLNREKISVMIGSARFNTEKEFKDFMKSKIEDNFLIDSVRTAEKSVIGGKRIDLHILDSLTKREPLIIIGLKTVNYTPQLSPDHIEAFHKECQAMNTLYGVLMTETEVHFYEYKKIGEQTEVKEIEEIRPLNHIDAEFGREITPEKLRDFLISRKKTVIALILLLILILATSLARGNICKTTGPVKGEVNSKGEKIYYLPESPGYNNRTTGDQKGERRFCDEGSAIDSGWVKSK